MPEYISVGQNLQAGTYLGRVGNSGTTYTPHIHLVFAFRDNGKYWSIPIEWENFNRRKIFYYASGAEYSKTEHIDFGYPKYNQMISFD